MTDDERDNLLIRIDENMKSAIGRINDHGTRIRAVERWQWTAWGAIGLLAAAFGIKLH